MQVGVLKTSGGAHTVELWATVTSSRIVGLFVVLPTSKNAVELQVAKDRLKVQIYDICLGFHKKVQEAERKMLAEGEHGRLRTLANPNDHCDPEECVQLILTALHDVLEKCDRIDLVSDEPELVWGLNKPRVKDEVVNCVRHAVHCDMNTIINIERDWHAIRNPELPESEDLGKIRTQGFFNWSAGNVKG